MEYEIVSLREKKIVGIIARTNNHSPEMGRVIGGLWEQFYGGGVYSSIQRKSNRKTLGIYTDYAGDETGDYSFIAACEVEQPEAVPQGTAVRLIPAGRYAKFVVRGDMRLAVAGFWRELWEMDLPRAFICDFEEYQDQNPENAEIHIYIGLRE